MSKYREPDIIFKWTNCCRLCLSQESTIDLFSEASISQHFPSKIRTCLNFLIYSGDPMPRKICATCCMKLENWFQFRKECMQTEKDLKKRLEPYKKIAFVKEYFVKYMKYDKSSRDGSVSMDSMSEYDEDEIGDEDEDEDGEDDEMEVYSDSMQKEDENSGLSDNDRIISKLEHQNFKNRQSIAKNSVKLKVNHTMGDKLTNADSSVKDKETNHETRKSTMNLQKVNLKNKVLDKDKHRNEITKKACSTKDVKVSAGKVTSMTEKSEMKPNNSYSQNKSSLVKLKTPVNNQNRKISEVHNPSMQEKNFKSCPECGIDFPNEEVFALHSCNVIESGPESDDNEIFINPLSFVDTSLSEPVKEASEGDGSAMQVESESAFKGDRNAEKEVLVTPWKCLVCSEYFKSVLDLKEHYKAGAINCITADINLDCEICKMKFKSKDDLIKHQLVHIDNKTGDKNIVPVKCCTCGGQFNDEEQLKQHACSKVEGEASQEMGGEHICSKCDQTFPNKELFDKHELIHNQQDIYNLIVTPQFTTFEGIEEIENLADENDHVDDGKKPTNVVRCFRCGRIFGSAEELEHHEFLKHKNPTPYFCRKCDLRFSARSQLLMHVRSHMRKSTTGAPNASGNSSDNTCSVCNAKFFLQSDLQSHLKMHKFATTEESTPPPPPPLPPPAPSPLPAPQKSLQSSELCGDNKIDLFARFKCSVCSKIFVHSGSIIRHGKNLHKGQTVYPLRLKRPIFLMKRARSLSLPYDKNLKSPQPSKPLASSNAVTVNSQQSQPVQVQVQVQEENFEMEASQESKWDQDGEGMKSDSNLDLGTEKCPFCEKVFKPTYLPRHIKRNHRGEVLDPQMLGKEIPDDSLICRYCLKSCSNPHNRRVHESIHYPVKMQCNQCKICGQKFFNKASYEVHILSCKSVRCGKCNKIFFRYLSLKNHSCIVTLPAENKA